jgi:hypothetical protein
MTKAALYMCAGDADPIVTLDGAPAAAIARRFISGDLTPAHSLTAALRSAREYAAAQSLFEIEDAHLVRIVLTA